MLNLTQHKATQDQLNNGVIEPYLADKECIQTLLTFNELPNRSIITERAIRIALIAEKYEQDSAMIGGAPFLMPILQSELLDSGIQPFYAFTKRESIEKTVDDKVIKTNVFKHAGFVEAV